MKNKIKEAFVFTIIRLMAFMLRRKLGFIILVNMLFIFLKSFKPSGKESIDGVIDVVDKMTIISYAFFGPNNKYAQKLDVWSSCFIIHRHILNKQNKKNATKKS